MKRMMILTFLFSILFLNALSIQEVNKYAEKYARDMQRSTIERTDFSMLYFQFLPYTVEMYNIAKEFQYTNTSEYRWDPVNNEYHLVNSANVTYSRGLPLTYTMTMEVQGQTITMEYTYEHQDQHLVGMSSTITMMGQTLDNTRETYTWEGDHLVSMLMEINVITDWMEDERATVTWTGDNLTQIVYENVIEDAWENTTRETIEYDGANATHWFEEEWEWGNSQWINSQQEDYTYAGGYLSESVEQVYHEGAWNNEERDSYTWENGAPVESLEQNWDGSQWYDVYHSTFTYDAQSNIIEIYTDEWVDGRSWNNFVHMTYSYGTANDNQSVPAVESKLDIYPNPFNPSTNISFSLASDSHVTLDVFNMRGQKVESLLDEHRDAGTYTIPWDAKTASGIYFIRMRAGSEEHIRKALLMK